MADSLIATVAIKCSAKFVKDLDLSDPADSLVKNYVEAFTTGTGANQAQVMFHDQRTLAASTSENLDLAGSLTAPTGGTLTFTAVKVLIIAAADGNTNNVEVGGAAAAQFTGPLKDASDIAVVRPGGAVCWLAPDATGYAVGSGTADTLKVANSGAGTGVTYDIIIIGEGSIA